MKPGSACRFVPVLVFFCPLACPQTHPAKPVPLVIGSFPGGGIDLAGRIITQKMSENLGQPVVVDNRGGADGHINISVLQFQQDRIDHGLDFTGFHHFGVHVDDLEGTAKKCLENGCVAYDELPEDPGEKAKNYRPKRSDQFKGPENALFDIADHPSIGAAPAKE